MPYDYYSRRSQNSQRRKFHSFYIFISVICTIIIMAIIVISFAVSSPFVSNPAITPIPTQSYYFN